MRHPWVNTALLALLALQLLTGAASLVSGGERFSWVFWLHGLGGYAVVALIVWKGQVVADTLRRRPAVTISRLAFLLLAGLALAILVSGIVWSTVGPLWLFGTSLLTLHGFLAVALLVLFVWHVLARRYVFRLTASRDRRAFLRLVGGGLLGLLLWRSVEPARGAAGLPGATRRFTGSYETGSLTGQFPPTIWLADYQAPLAAADWRLTIDGAVARPLTLAYAETLALATASARVTLDCTGGWHTMQEWQGVPLAALLDLAGLDPAARSVTIESASGYGRRFPLAEARGLLLATAVAGRPLDHEHGFPVRLVAPDHRGFAWVKWVTRVRVTQTSHLCHSSRAPVRVLERRRIPSGSPLIAARSHYLSVS